MTYDGNVPAPQGAVKLSEIVVDRDQAVIDVQSGDSSIVLVEQLRGVITDLLMRNNYMLHSEGIIDWDSAGNLAFNDTGVLNNIIFTVLQTPARTARNVNLVMQATLGANDATHFNTIALANDELLYIEIDRSLLLANQTGTITLANAVGGGSLVSGQTVRKISLASGIPALFSPKVGTPTTLFIPLCWRHDWGGTNKDLLWIPHGIRWPQNTQSTLGAIIVRGLEIYPSAFVTTKAELKNAFTYIVGLTGGIVCVSQSFAVDEVISIPAGVTLLGRTSLDSTANLSMLTMTSTGGFTMGARARVKDLFFNCQSGFGQTTDRVVLTASGGRGVIDNCAFTFANTATAGTYGAIGVQFASNFNRVLGCKFNSVAALAYRLGVQYQSGAYNSDIECEYT